MFASLSHGEDLELSGGEGRGLERIQTQRMDSVGQTKSKCHRTKEFHAGKATLLQFASLLSRMSSRGVAVTSTSSVFSVPWPLSGLRVVCSSQLPESEQARRVWPLTFITKFLTDLPISDTQTKSPSNFSSLKSEERAVGPILLKKCSFSL